MNDEIKKYFKKAIKGDNLFQSYLFCGPTKTGKIEMIKFLKEAILKNKEDFIEINTEDGKRDINIDQIRDLTKAISYKENDDKRKIILIKNADKMNSAAANSLLKVLEEPRNGVIFILLVDQEDEVISTIRSRCQKVFFHLKGIDEIKDYLKERFPDKSSAVIEKATLFSKGRYLLAEDIINKPDILDEKQQVFDDFRKAIKGSWSDGMSLADKLAGGKGAKTNRGKILDDIDHWTWSLMEFLKSDFRQSENIQAQKKIFQIVKNLLELKRRIKYSNANEKLQLENFFIQTM